MGRNTRLAILIGLGAIAILSFVHGLSSLSKGSPPPAKESLPSAPSSTVLTETLAPTTGRTARSRYFAWGRNPFTFEEKSPVIQKASLSLNGIAWDKEKPQAVINGRIVGVGDTVAGQRVVSIKQDRVILNDGVSNIELHLWRKK